MKIQTIISNAIGAFVNVAAKIGDLPNLFSKAVLAPPVGRRMTSLYVGKKSESGLDKNSLDQSRWGRLMRVIGYQPRKINK